MGPGDRVATVLPPGIAFAELLHAVPRLGAVLVPLNPRDPGGIGGLVVGEPLAGDEADVELRTTIEPGATLAIIHTSGTTAAPKPVELTYGNFEASAAASAANLGVEPGDRWLCAMPLFHVGGLSILTRSAIYGTCAVVHERFDAAAVRASLESGEATLVSLVATMLGRLREAGLERAPALRAALIGGGPVPGELMEWASGIGLPVVPTYGMTETCSQIATPRLLPGVEVRTGEGGELLVRGPMVAPGALGADGWLHTGDRGRVEPDGTLHVEGRIKDAIVTGGENVAAAEVEAALIEHPGVMDAAVIGVEDPEWGRAITAFVVATATAEQIDAHARARLPGFKVPKRIVVVDELPRTASGKVQRAQLESRAHDLRQRR